MNVIDIGVNFTHKSFKNDLKQVINRAKGNGVSKLILTGTSLNGSQESLSLAESHEGLYSTAGIHPHHAKEWSEKVSKGIKELLPNKKVVAVGECGLDFNRNFSSKQDQEKCFAEQIQLANEYELPLFLHEREAFDCFYRIMKEVKQDDIRAVVHCFTSNKKALESYLDAGYFIGITGWICDERRGKQLQELISYIPVDRLMIETDAPFLTPRDLPGGNRRNEPSNLGHILNTIARLMNKDENVLAEKVYQNTVEFFDLE